MAISLDINVFPDELWMSWQTIARVALPEPASTMTTAHCETLRGDTTNYCMDGRWKRFFEFKLVPAASIVPGDEGQ